MVNPRKEKRTSKKIRVGISQFNIRTKQKDTWSPKGHFKGLKRHQKIQTNKWRHKYRVYQSELVETRWLWGIAGSIFFSNQGALWLQEVWTFEFLQSVLKKVTLAGLNSLWQKYCQISVKISMDSLDHLY